MSSAELDKYRGLVRRFFDRKEFNYFERADLVQETFTRYLAKSARETVEHPKALLLTIARNLLTDRARRRVSRAYDHHVPLDEVEIPAAVASPEKAAMDGQAVRALENAMAELPPPCRRALILHRFEGMTYQQIARHMGISVSMVQKHMARALMELSERLDDAAGG